MYNGFSAWSKAMISGRYWPYDWFAQFPHFNLHHCVRNPEKPPSWENSTNQVITDRKMLALPVWRAEQDVTTFSASPKCSASRETPILRKRHESINYWQENADTTCFWPVLTFGGSALFPFCHESGHTFTETQIFVWCIITHDMKGGITPT